MGQAGVLENGSLENGLSDKLDVGWTAGKKKTRTEAVSMAGHKIIQPIEGDEGHSFIQPFVFLERPLSTRHFARHWMCNCGRLYF